MRTHNIPSYYRKSKRSLFIPPDLALLSTLIGSNYPCLELIFMVSKVFEPLKFDCISVFVCVCMRACVSHKDVPPEAQGNNSITCTSCHQDLSMSYPLGQRQSCMMYVYFFIHFFYFFFLFFVEPVLQEILFSVTISLVTTPTWRIPFVVSYTSSTHS